MNVQMQGERSEGIHHHFIGLILPISFRMMMSLRECCAGISYREDTVPVEENDMNDEPIKGSKLLRKHNSFSKYRDIMVLLGDLDAG